MDFENLKTLLNWFEEVLTALINGLAEGIETAKGWYEQVKE